MQQSGDESGSAAPTQDESGISASCASGKSGGAGSVAKGRLNNGTAALMREANEIGSGARARQECGVRQRSAAFRTYSSLGFDLRGQERRMVQLFERLCLY